MILTFNFYAFAGSHLPKAFWFRAVQERECVRAFIRDHMLSLLTRSILQLQCIWGQRWTD